MLRRGPGPGAPWGWATRSRRRQRCATRPAPAGKGPFEVLGRQPRVRHRRQLVGATLDVVPQRATGRRRRAVARHQPPRREPLARRLPVLGRPAPADLEQLGVGALGRRHQHVHLAPVQPRRAEERDVCVAAVLTQRRRQVPEVGHGISRPRHVPVGGEQRTTRRVGGLGDGGERRDHIDSQIVGVVTGKEAPQRRGGCRAPDLQHCGGGDPGPGVGDGPADPAGMEVVECGLDHPRAHRPERRGPAGEVPHPEPCETQVGGRLAALGGEVRHRVDRLEAVPQGAGQRGFHGTIMGRRPPGRGRIASAAVVATGGSRNRRPRASPWAWTPRCRYPT